MSYKRQLWTSGYEYRVRCPYCGTMMRYTDRQLGYRSWHPNGFIYCAGCRRPIKHSEFFAVHPDGTPVYKTVEEANAALITGYQRAFGIPVAHVAAPVQTPPAPAAQNAPNVPEEGFAFCVRCGTRYEIGKAAFCASCGNKLGE